jgi:hypothetical protein
MSRSNGGFRADAASKLAKWWLHHPQGKPHIADLEGSL